MARFSCRSLGCAILCWATAIAPANADETGDAEAAEEVKETTDPAPVAASLEGIGAATLPGLLVHGTGLWVRGDKKGARNLFTLELVGLSLAASSGVLLGSTGASRRIANQTIPLLITGSAIFVQSWLADIYGSAGGGRRQATKRLELEPVTAIVGGFYVRDEQFDYGPFTRAAARFHLGAFRIDPELVIGIGGNNQRLAVDSSFRLYGPRGRRSSGDSSYVEVGASARSHRFGRERFVTNSASVSAAGRLDFARIGRSMAGSFAELSVGFGLDATRFQTGSQRIDVNDAILVRYAYGLVLGRRGSVVRGEAMLFYNHRRDEFAGGISPGDQAGGFLGFFGASLDLDIGARWGVVAEIEKGSALVVGLGLKARFGKARQ